LCFFAKKFVRTKKKSEKSQLTATPKFKEEKKKKGREIRRVLFSLLSERVLSFCERNAPSRAIALVSLSSASAFCSSHQNNAFKELRALKKDKNILVHVMCIPRDAFVHQKKRGSETHEKSDVLFEKKSFLETRRDFRGAPRSQSSRH